MEVETDNLYMKHGMNQTQIAINIQNTQTYINKEPWRLTTCPSTPRHRCPRVRHMFTTSAPSNNKSRLPYCRFSNVHVLCIIPDPEVLNSRMRACPETNIGFTMVYHIVLCTWMLDLRPSI